MAKVLHLEPDGWPCTLIECPPGPFLWQDQICFKSEYRKNNGSPEAYNSAGEFFCPDPETTEVQPVKPVWKEVEGWNN